MLGTRDEGLLAAGLEVPNDGLNFRRHGAAGEVLSFGQMRARFRQAHSVHPLLLGRAEAQRNLFNGGCNEEQVGVDLDARAGCTRNPCQSPRRSRGIPRPRRRRRECPRRPRQ